jgi:preprotein translocase subunit YajC
MKLFWMIVAGICIAAAAVYMLKGDFNTAFVIAVLGMIFWFFNYRAQMKEVISAAEVQDKEGEEPNEN